ncbi:MAG: EF-hand domain-containing protein [Cyanobacteria bacterium P01_G01_bin.54]
MVYTSPQLQDFKAAFTQYDKDESGAIDPTELGQVLRDLGELPSEAAVTEMIASVDKNENGQLEFGEFLNLLAPEIYSDRGLSLKEFKAAFIKYDQDQSGTIDPTELGKVLRDLGETSAESDVAAMLEAVDTNENGQLEFGEFLALMIPGFPEGEAIEIAAEAPAKSPPSQGLIARIFAKIGSWFGS